MNLRKNKVHFAFILPSFTFILPHFHFSQFSFLLPLRKSVILGVNVKNT